MQNFRQNMPVVVFTLAIAFIILMVMGDFLGGSGGSSIFGGPSTGIATVNGEALDIQEYNRTLSQYRDAMRAQNPDADVDEQFISDQVFTMMVDQMIVRQAADRLGIVVSDAQVREELLRNPPQTLVQSFTDSTGRFMQDMYLEFMSNPAAFLSARGFPESEIENYRDMLLQQQEAVRYTLLESAVKSVVTASAIPAPVEIRNAFNRSRTKLNGSFAFLPSYIIPDSAVNVSDDEVKEYYQSHKAMFTRKPSREVKYVTLPLAASASDSASIRTRLQRVLSEVGAVAAPEKKDSVFNSFVAQYGAGRYTGEETVALSELTPEMQNALSGAKPGDIIGPVRTSEGTFLIDVVDTTSEAEEYVKAQHILLRTDGTNDDSVKALASTVYQKARSGEDFQSLVAQYSGDPGSAQRGGDLGYFKKGAMVPEFEKAAFGASPGTITPPVKSQFGYHIIKVNDRGSKGFRIRDLRFDVNISNTTRNLILRRAKTFKQRVEEGEQFDSVAADMGLQVTESGPVTRNQEVAGTSRIGSFAYNNDAGDVSEPIRSTGGDYIIAQITNVNTGGIAEFENVRPEIEQILRERRKLDQLAKRAQKLIPAIKRGDSLGTLSQIDPEVQVSPLANQIPDQPYPVVGFDAKLAAAALAQRPGTTSELIRGERGYYVIRIDDRVEPTDADWQKDRAQFTSTEISKRQQALFEKWKTMQRERAEIVDNRSY